MVECSRHVNLVKVPANATESEALISRTLQECDYRQRSLLKQLVGILEGDKLARLSCTSVSVSALRSPCWMMCCLHPLRSLTNLSREG